VLHQIVRGQDGYEEGSEIDLSILSVNTGECKNGYDRTY
jgi:hypothetical protein